MIKIFRFFLGYPFVIICSRSQDQILPVCLIHTFRHHFRIKNHRKDFFTKFFHCFPFTQRQLQCIHTIQCVSKKFRSETWYELIRSIMMMNSVRKPYAFQISFQIDEIHICTISLILCIYGFQHFTNKQIVFAILIKQNITALQSSL